MAGVHQPPEGGKGGLPSTALALDDADALRAWIRRVSDTAADLAAAGDDATRPPGQRDLGRRMARAKVLESHRSLRDLVAMFEAGLPAGGAGG